MLQYIAMAPNVFVVNFNAINNVTIVQLNCVLQLPIILAGNHNLSLYKVDESSNWTHLGLSFNVNRVLKFSFYLNI